MKFETKYSIGDEVVIIRNRQHEVRVPCAACSAKGQITLADGDEVPCPRCWNDGYNRAWEPTCWRYETSGFVGKVSFSTQIDEEGELTSQTDYMIDATGIGSGSVWSEDKVWTEGTWKAECDRLNAESSEEK